MQNRLACQVPRGVAARGVAVASLELELGFCSNVATFLLKFFLARAKRRRRQKSQQIVEPREWEVGLGVAWLKGCAYS